jgi:hypothetical protein
MVSFSQPSNCSVYLNGYTFTLFFDVRADNVPQVEITKNLPGLCAIRAVLQFHSTGSDVHTVEVSEAISDKSKINKLLRGLDPAKMYTCEIHLHIEDPSAPCICFG